MLLPADWSAATVGLLWSFEAREDLFEGGGRVAEVDGGVLDRTLRTGDLLFDLALFARVQVGRKVSSA